MKHDNYAYWKACRKAHKEGADRPEPSTDLYPLGFWKMQNGVPVAIWPDPESATEIDGKTVLPDVIIQIGTKAKPVKLRSEKAEERLEYGGFGVYVSEPDYRVAFDTGEWPWKEPAVPGGNAPPAEGTPEAYAADIEKVEGEIAALVAKPIESQTTADAVQNLRDKATKLKTGAIDLHRVEKEPHLSAGREVDGKWFPLRDRADAASKTANRALTAFLTKRQEELDRKAREERQRLQDEANAKAAEESRATGTTVEAEQVAEVEPEKARVGNTRKASLTKVKVAKITDLDKAIAAIMASQSNAWKEALAETVQKIANGAMKAGIPLDGVEIVEESKAS